MFRRTLGLVIVFSLLIPSFAIQGYTQIPIRVFIDDAEKFFSPAPLIVNGLTLIPMRAFFEALGATIEWNDATQSIIGQRGDTMLKLWINKRTALVNSVEIPLAIPAQILFGRTYIPLRFVGEALGAKVVWDNYTIYLTSPPVATNVPAPITTTLTVVTASGPAVQGVSLYHEGVLLGVSDQHGLIKVSANLGDHVVLEASFQGRSMAIPVAIREGAGRVVVGTSLVSTSPQGHSTTKLIVQTQGGIIGPGVSVYLNDKLLGISDTEGVLLISPNFGQYIFVHTRRGHVSSSTGVNIHRGEGVVLVPDSMLRDQWAPGSNTIAVFMPPNINPNNRQTVVTVTYDLTIPPAEKAYMEDLFSIIDPAIRAIIGAPIQNSAFRIVYNPQQHGGWRDNKQTLTLSRLPSLSGENDQVWDEWALINYIHKFLEGRAIPIPGARSFENLAHPIKDLVAVFLTQRGLRSITGPAIKPIQYYLQAYSAYESLGPNILLNTGGTSSTLGQHNPHDFLWENESYNRMNGISLQYAKSLYFTLAEARSRQTGELDFFYAYLNAMASANPQTPAQFFAMMDQLVWSVDGIKTSDWMKKAAGFQGKTDSPLAFELLPVRGDFFNIGGIDNPNVVYPFVVARSPARVVATSVVISIFDENGRMHQQEVVTSGFPDGSGHPAGMRVNNLPPGRYIVTGEAVVNGVTFKTEKRFCVVNAFPDYILRLPNPKAPQRHTKITISYAASVPQHAREYLDRLIALIDPIIRAFVGEPVQNHHIEIQHDPHGRWTMNRDMTVLNFPRLPLAGAKLDTSIDSYFFIEYFHGFHSGRTIPIEDARYGANISHAMRVILGHYLMQHGLRETTGRSITSYLRSRKAIETLGPGILVNLGVPANASDGFVPDRRNWQIDGAYAMEMNFFTSDYALSPWLVLADAAYQKTGQYDFFRRFQEALVHSTIRNEREFYDLIDRLVDVYIEGQKASDWLRATPLFQGLPAGEIFIRPLPAEGNWFDIGSVNNPTFIYPLVVQRKSLATILDIPVLVEIVDSAGVVVASDTITVGFIPPYNNARGMLVPRNLPRGLYIARVTARINGMQMTGEQSFWVTR